MNYFQQGDCLLFEGKKPLGAKIVKSGVIIQSDKTGHSHKVHQGKLYKKGEDLFVVGPAVIKHQEHNPVELPKGTYRVQQVMEYDHMEEESRKVID